MPEVVQKSVFLEAEWRKLAMANYAIDPAALTPYIPYKTELDLWANTCYVSLVGFVFLNTRLKGIKIPFHSNFEEVNLRFYVRYKDGSEWKRGVVFIKEIVPRAALTFVANVVYGENYETMRMSHQWMSEGKFQEVEYKWNKDKWHSLRVKAETIGQEISEGSEEEFITEHFWGYTRISGKHTSEYGVEHPRRNVYPVVDYSIDVNFGEVYGNSFAFLNQLSPKSVFLAEGSEIIVRSGSKIND